MKSFKNIFLILVFIGMFCIPGFVGAQDILWDGTLVKGTAPEVYFMENGMKRWVTNPTVFDDFGFEWGKIKTISDEALSRHPLGQNLENTTRYPEGALLREKDGINVFVIKNGARSWVKDEQSFVNLGLQWDSIFDIEKEKIEKTREIKVTEQVEFLRRPITVLKIAPDAVLEDTAVEFEFTAIADEGNLNNISFETFLEGHDKRWVRASGQKRKINLPEESKNYDFFIRAKYKDGGVDLTPEKSNFTVKISPLFKSVIISSVRARQKEVSNELLYLRSRSNIPVSITGWTLESKKNRSSYKIPQVFEVPKHIYFKNQINLTLAPRETAIINSGEGSAGDGFRLNKCTGYLNNNTIFNPPLPRQCPLPSRSEINDLPFKCKNIASRVPRCGEPDFNDISVNNECRAYLRENFGYARCVEKNRQYYDFFKNEWRVYLGLTKPIWKEVSDSIILRDRNGLVVSIYKY